MHFAIIIIFSDASAPPPFFFYNRSNALIEFFIILLYCIEQLLHTCCLPTKFSVWSPDSKLSSLKFQGLVCTLMSHCDCFLARCKIQRGNIYVLVVNHIFQNWNIYYYYFRPGPECHQNLLLSSYFCLWTFWFFFNVWIRSWQDDSKDSTVRVTMTAVKLCESLCCTAQYFQHHQMRDLLLLLFLNFKTN